MVSQPPSQLVSAVAADVVEPIAFGAHGQEDRRLLFAAAAALTLHLLPVLAATGSLSFLGLAGRPPAEERVGVAAGEPEGVNIETIDTDEFNRRYVSFMNGKDDATTEQPEAPPTNPMPPQKAAAAAPKAPEPPPLSSAPGDSPAVPPPPPPVPQVLSQADIAEIIEATRLDRPSAVQLLDKGASARNGVTSEFAKAVVRRVQRILPAPNGLKGTVVIGFVISDTGEVAKIVVLQGSPNAAFDNVVVERVRATRFAPPDKTVRPNERIFKISYEFG